MATYPIPICDACGNVTDLRYREPLRITYSGHTYNIHFNTFQCMICREYVFTPFQIMQLYWKVVMEEIKRIRSERVTLK